MNPADPSARALKGKNETKWVYGDNALLTVTRHQVILALESYGTVSDQGTLDLSLDTARCHLDSAGITDPMRLHLADAGFASTTALCTPREGISLIALPRRFTTNPTACSDLPGYQQILNRLRNPAGLRLYRHRMGMVEPVFAHLTQKGGRNLHFRGPARATEMIVMGIAHNMGKLVDRCRELGIRPGRDEQSLKTLTVRKRNFL